MDRPLNRRIELHQIKGVPHTLAEGPELIVHGLDLDGIKRDESRLSRTLVAHIFDTVDGRFLLVDDDSIDVSTKDNGYCRFVLSFGRFAEIYESAANTWRKAGLEEQGYESGFTHLGIFVASWRWSPSSWSLSPTPVSRRLLEAAGGRYSVASHQLRPVICLMKKSLNGRVVEEAD